MKRPQPQTLAASGVLVLLAFIAIVTSHGGPSPADSYASTDYAGGGYRAWAALLAREGIATARFVRRPIELDAGTDTLVSAQPAPGAADPNARTAADLSALAAWVRGGGRLVYVGRNVGLTGAENRALQLPFWLPGVGARGPLRGPAAAAVQSLAELGTNRMLLVEHPGSALLADGNGEIVVRYPLGHGEVIAVADPVPFTNAQIARADNARLAYLIALPRRSAGVVAFDDAVHGALVDRPWYRALPVPVRVTLGLGALALLLALIGSALRGPPAMRLEPAREPTSAEFVAAVAALYERVGARSAARDILVHDALGSAGAAGASTAVERLARAGGPVSSDADFLASAKLAHLVRKDRSYDPDGDGRRTAFAGRTRTRRRR
jgi:hypothetical protein